jgi:hypothetical protein
MRRLPRLAAGAIAAALALFATSRTPAASVLDFDLWMRAIDKRSVSVQKAIAAHDTAAAADDARELERLYALMEDWFVKDGNAPDAVTIAHDGRTLAAAIPAALDAHDEAAALQSARGIAHACNDCHDTYKPFK